VVGATRLPVSEKYFQLANCYFKSGKKQDALTNYLKTKEVLAANKRNSTHEYGVVLLKLAVLELNFGRINQAIEFGLESLGLFER
jgi:tetratricopeptide (TPR) repeat protein